MTLSTYNKLTLPLVAGGVFRTHYRTRLPPTFGRTLGLLRRYLNTSGVGLHLRLLRRRVPQPALCRTTVRHRQVDRLLLMELILH